MHKLWLHSGLYYTIQPVQTCNTLSFSNSLHYHSFTSPHNSSIPRASTPPTDVTNKSWETRAVNFPVKKKISHFHELMEFTTPQSSVNITTGQGSRKLQFGSIYFSKKMTQGARS